MAEEVGIVSTRKRTPMPLTEQFPLCDVSIAFDPAAATLEDGKMIVPLQALTLRIGNGVKAKEAKHG